jgi:hypothetical protein
MAKYKQGKYLVKKPEKYTGDLTQVFYRSSWEQRFMIWCDTNSNIIQWSSEETIIPYRCGTDNKIHRYYIDFQIKVKNKDGFLKTYLVEIKPSKERFPPVYKGKQTKRYINESMTYIKNQSKWEAATQYAKDRGYEFIILSETELGIK